MDRKFGHCVANWRIINSYILPMKKEWQIHSPVFEVRGFRPTRWIMKILNKKIHGEFNLYFQLQYINSEEKIPPFFGKCNLEISKESGNCFSSRDEFCFNEFVPIERILKIIRRRENDPMISCNLCIKFKLFINFIHVKEEFETCLDIGIRELSQDLLTVFENKRNTDVILKVQDTNQFFNIEAHKHILRSRNNNLKNILDSRKNSMTFVVDHCGHYEEWNNVLKFFYTANMRHVLDPPSEVYYDISVTYDIEPITSYYEPDELNLYSTISVEEVDITHTISEFLTCSQNSQVQKDTLGTHFKIYLYPKSFYNENDTCICAEIAGEVHKMILVEIFAINAHKKGSLNLIYGEIADNIIYRGYTFAKRNTLIQYLQDENLTLNFKIQMVNLNLIGEYKQYSPASIVKCKPYSYQKNYSILSADMSNLCYNICVYDKLNFLIAGEECFIHRCILSARAPSLYEKILQSKNVEYKEVRRKVLNDLIYFLYSGKYKFSRLEDLFALHDLADTFKIESLKRLLFRKFRVRLRLGYV